jgi:hypothetical protein
LVNDATSSTLLEACPMSIFVILKAQVIVWRPSKERKNGNPLKIVKQSIASFGFNFLNATYYDF